MIANKSVYVRGETAAFAVADCAYASVTLLCGATSVAMSLAADAGVWTATVNTGAFEGRVNYAALADGVAVATGSFYVRPLVSKYRAVVEAIDAALQKVAVNGKYSVAVGEISLQDKTFDEMAKFRAHYAALAEGEENGTGSAGGPVRTTGGFE